jgi:hypothetical protein
MEPQEQLQCSQQPATGPYPKLHKSNPHLLPYFFKIHFIWSPTYTQVFQVVFFFHLNSSGTISLSQGTLLCGLRVFNITNYLTLAHV